MSRNLLVAAFVSLALHAGIALSGRFFKEKPAGPPPEVEIPTIPLDLPPPPEPEEPEVYENNVSDTPAAIAEFAPPMQNDLPSAVMDSPFMQPMQAPPPPGLTRPIGAITLPSGPPRPAGGGGLTNIFNLADLDQKPEARVQTEPSYPFEMRRSGMKGEVKLRFVVDTQGNVRDLEVVSSSHPGFEQAALDAAITWKFKPGRKAGVPQNTRVSLPVTFNLNAK